MKIALWGYYGHNYGDDVMLRVIIDFCINNNIELEVIDMFDGKLNKIYQSENFKVYNWKKTGTLRKIFKLKKLASNKIINIWGGGTIFTDNEGDGNFRIFNLISKLGGKIGYLGIGIGKLTKKERIDKTIHLLKECDFAIFRDENSYKRALEYSDINKFCLAEDLSFLYFENKKSYKTNSKDNYILITWRNLKNYMSNNDEYLLMNKVVDNSIRLGTEMAIDKIILSAIDTVHDVESCEKLEQLFKSKGKSVIYNKDSSIESLTKIIANSTFHFSGRLHGSVASEYFNVPTLSLSYSPKIKYFYKSIKKDNYIDVYHEDLSFGNVKKAFLNNRNIEMEDHLKKAQLNFEFLISFINREVSNE